MKVAIVLLAAGRGTRFGGPVPKAYLVLAGTPLVVHSARRLLRATAAYGERQLVVAVHPDDRTTHLASCLPALEAACGAACRLAIVEGGASRQESMERCLAAVDAAAELVVVHDAARALLPIPATQACLAAAERSGAALLAVPVPDTLKRVQDGRITATVDRAGLWLAQTPQVVRRDLLVRGLAHARASGFTGTDDVSLVEAMGAEVTVVPGSPTNLKITQPDDLPLAAALLAAERS